MLPENLIGLDIKLLYELYITSVEQILTYFKDITFCLSFWVVGYLLLSLLVYVKYARKLPTRTRGSLWAKRVLIVTAHPDDECMFFGPSVFRLCEQGAEVYLMCLSNGNFEGKGKVRCQELWNACQELGIPESNISLIADTRLPDNPKVQWPVNHIAKIIEHQLESLDIDTLITFDRGGVSSHPNHSAIFYAVAFMFVEKRMPEKCTVYTLDSVNILRKYWGYLDILLSFILSSKRYLLRWSESRRVIRAMRHHQSQMVWFRRLNVLFSRYIIINTLRRINLADIELELEVDE